MSCTVQHGLEMIGKPFRPPLLANVNRSATSLVKADDDEPQAKKRRVGTDEEHRVTSSEPRLVFKTPGISSLPRKPLSEAKNGTGAVNGLHTDDHGMEGYYNVLW